MKKIIVFITFSCLSLLITSETTLDFGKFGEREILDTFEPSDSLQPSDPETKNTQASSSCTGYVWLQGYLKVKTTSYWFYRTDKVTATSSTRYGSATQPCGSSFNAKELSAESWYYNSYAKMPIKKKTIANYSTIKAERTISNSFVSIISNGTSTDISKAAVGDPFKNYVYSTHKATMPWGTEISVICKLKMKF